MLIRGSIAMMTNIPVLQPICEIKVNAVIERASAQDLLEFDAWVVYCVILKVQPMTVRPFR